LSPGRKYLLDGKVTVDGQAACLVLDPAGKVSRAMLLNGTQLACGGYSLKGKGLRRVKVKQVDYERGIVALAAPVLTKDLRPGLSEWKT
jgi:hypothetical protein